MRDFVFWFQTRKMPNKIEEHLKRKHLTWRVFENCKVPVQNFARAWRSQNLTVDRFLGRLVLSSCLNFFLYVGYRARLTLTFPIQNRWKLFFFQNTFCWMIVLKIEFISGFHAIYENCIRFSITNGQNKKLDGTFFDSEWAFIWRILRLSDLFYSYDTQFYI